MQQEGNVSMGDDQLTNSTNVNVIVALTPIQPNDNHATNTNASAANNGTGGNCSAGCWCWGNNNNNTNTTQAPTFNTNTNANSNTASPSTNNSSTTLTLCNANSSSTSTTSSSSSSTGHSADSERRYRPQKYCAVCGDKAIACNFNAVTCESCKAFFRRNAFKEQRLKCLFDNRCIIDRVTRRFCSKCRLIKCFQIGMKREWILTDEQKLIKRVKIMQNKQSRQQVSGPSSPFACDDQSAPTFAQLQTAARNDGELLLGTNNNYKISEKLGSITNNNNRSQIQQTSLAPSQPLTQMAPQLSALAPPPPPPPSSNGSLVSMQDANHGTASENPTIVCKTELGCSLSPNRLSAESNSSNSSLTTLTPTINRVAKFDFEGRHWSLENQNGRVEDQFTIQASEMNQSVSIYCCEQITVIVNGKINSISVDRCKKMTLVFHDVVSTVEFTNCQSIQAQPMGRVPTINLDKTEGFHLYLRKESLDVELMSTQSADINVCLINQTTGDYKVHTIPEQLKTRWIKGEFKTEALNKV